MTARASHGLIALLTLFVCASCAQRDDAGESAAAPASPPATASPVLVTVDGEPITQRDVESSAGETLGALGKVMLEGANRRTILQGLVTRKAMAKLEEKQLDVVEREAMEADVRAYRERLLARRYIERHATSLDPSEQDVKAYYESHAERFGARSLKTFEMLATDFSKAGPSRTERLRMLKEIETSPDWAEQSKLPAYTGWARHVRGSSELGSLAAPLRKKIQGLSKDDPAAIVLAREQAYMVRVTGVTVREPRGLDVVRHEIKETLKPTLYRDAVQRIQQDVLAKVKVEYPKP